ncbi:MAG: polysaccharide deacetylase family protein [Pseudobdellovibrionaceae bacterium]
MRILHLLSQTELTGAEVYAQNLITTQVEDRHSVFVISDRIHVPLPVEWKSLPISTARFFQRLQNILELRKFLKDSRIEVIHCHSRGAVRHAFWARFGLQVAMVTSLHGRQHFSWSKRFLNIYGDLQIAVCENVKKAMEIDFHMPGSAIRVLRNPIPACEKPTKPTKPFPHIGLLGRSSGPKGEGFEQVGLHCFEAWLKLAPQLRISVIAPRPERFSQAFQDKVKSLNFQFPGQIQFLGEVPKLREKLNELDLTLCSGRIAVESLLAEVPVLAMGESTSHGLVRQQNLPEVLSSNFGDIGSGSIQGQLKIQQIRDAVLDFLSGQKVPGDELTKIRQCLEVEFNPSHIHQEVIEIYRAARMKRWHPQWIPILMYHKVPLQPLQSQHRIFVTQAVFKKQLQYLRRKGFHSLTFKELFQFWMGETPLELFPKKPLLLTFDDGYKDNLEIAEPLLKLFRFRATIFLLGNHQILENTWDANTGEKPAPLMSLEEKQRLSPAVWEIGSHGFDHLHLPEVSEEKAFEEIQKSKTVLEKDLSTQIYCFAYPFGSTNQKIAELAKKASYPFAVNTDQGGLHLADQPHSLFRVNIFPEDGIFQLWKKTSTWYRRYFYHKRHR